VRKTLDIVFDKKQQMIFSSVRLTSHIPSAIIDSLGFASKNAIGILVAACGLALLTDYGFARWQ